MSPKDKIYFASDFHLGLGPAADARKRELQVVKWLGQIQGDAKVIYLVGDLFDYWWEFKKVVPKGFTRFLGKISEITDAGTEVHFFPGNHDMWIGDYLSAECGMILHEGPVTVLLNGKKFHIAHGHGLPADSNAYKVLLWIFRNRFIQRLYSALHPRYSVALGQRWSSNSRLGKGYSHQFKGEENESLFIYAREILRNEKIDYFVFGHRHLALDHQLTEGGRLTILGNWFSAPCYLKWDGTDLTLIEFTYR
ncbi:MAG TPA: UDP-2,3-diacylglucosamine diphosphatase [Bacteroidales bacterium]|nr:UDP-2,3-diacylglucosamine diphosphatase [Bacteroidales bacterium]